MAKVSGGASGLLHSDLEAQLTAKLAQSEANAGGGDKKKSTRVVKKVRLTPAKVLSMARGDQKSRTQESPDLDPSTDEVAPKRGTRKEQKKEVKDALFGPGKFNPKLKKRGSSTDNEGVVLKGKKQRRKKRKEEPPPPKVHTPPSPEPKSPPKDPTPPPPEEPPEVPPPEKSPTEPEPTPKVPTPPPPKEPTPPPKEPTPPPPTPPKELTPPAEVETAAPAQDEAPDNTKPEGEEAIVMEEDEEIVPQEAIFQPVSKVSRTKSSRRRHKNCSIPSFSSLCCPSKYGTSLRGRLKWLMVLIYRGPICYMGKRTLEKSYLPPHLLGPTFDSLLLEYLHLLLDTADALILSIYPDLKFEKIDLVREKDTDEESDE